MAVYGVDIFTAANLLFFDRWSGQVKPVIPFRISRWIFATCILLSWILLVYRWVRAVRAMRTGVVAASYLDPLAFMIQSVRTGSNGRGWRRFLVFAELTKGRKGAEYVALFTYFSFEGKQLIPVEAHPWLTALAWLRIVFAEGPRQVINALTLYSVMQANLVPVGEHAPKKGGSLAAQFFINVRILANHNKEQAAILFGMLFTLIVWAIAAISLILAAWCYILFLWHYIPTADDGLSGYCRRKVDSRLREIVGVKVKRALAIDLSPKPGSHSKPVRDGTTPARVTRKPTLPMLEFGEDGGQKELPISRRTTETTLPLYTLDVDDEKRGRSDHGARAEFVIPYLPPFQNRPAPFLRTATNSSAHSNNSYASDAPLLRAAGEMGYEPPAGSHPAAAPLSPRSGRQNPPSMERDRANIPNGTQRSHDPFFRPPRSQGRKAPGPMLSSHPGPQNPRQSEFSTSASQLRSSKESDDFGAAAQELSPLDRSGGRTAKPPEHQAIRIRENDVQHPKATADKIDSSRSNDGAYVAFNPHLRTGSGPRNNPAIGPTRNFTMPFNRRPPNATPPPQQQQQIVTPYRPGTAFNPANTHSQIARNPTVPSHSQAPRPTTHLPPRAATTAPGLPTWDGSKMFH